MTTVNFQWADIAVGQSQKETTHNDVSGKQDSMLGSKVQITVTTANIALSDAQHNEFCLYEFTGTMTANRDVTFKGRGRSALAWHNCAGGFTITLKAGSGAGSNVVLSPGDKRLVYIDGAANAVQGPF